MNNEFEIFFQDLRPEIQKELLEFFKKRSPEELNWDVFPVTSVYRGEIEDK